jgi:NAD(P)-dependent dehydrogenase (short-subunit alcohol dehydrogenase family)
MTAQPTLPFAHQVALVTGGTRGIGAAIATRLAQDGADIAVTYVSNDTAAGNLVASLQAMGRRVRAYKVDSADVGAVRTCVDRAFAELGRLDILVNCAGIGPFAPIDRLPLEKFEHAYAVNVRGAFVAIQTALQYLGRGGRIINIGSVAAHSVPLDLCSSVISLTKAATAGFTKALARELGPRGITVNIIHPGLMVTERMTRGEVSAAALEQALARCAIREFVQPAEIGALAAYIASEPALHVTGAEFTLDAGFGL